MKRPVYRALFYLGESISAFLKYIIINSQITISFHDFILEYSIPINLNYFYLCSFIFSMYNKLYQLLTIAQNPSAIITIVYQLRNFAPVLFLVSLYIFRNSRFSLLILFNVMSPRIFYKLLWTLII